MDIKTWYREASHWLCERWDCLWNVKVNEPSGKLERHWQDHINDK